MTVDGAGLRSDDYYYSMLRATYINPITGESFIFIGTIPATEATREEIIGDSWDPNGNLSGVTIRVERDYFASASGDQIRAWIDKLREMDRNGEIPAEWYDLVSGGLTIVTQFSNIIEANTFINVRDVATRPIYNYYTANEKDTSIENAYLPKEVGVNLPRYIEVLWIPIGDPLLVDPNQIVIDIETNELRDGARIAANNFNGTTINVNLELDRRFR